MTLNRIFQLEVLPIAHLIMTIFILTCHIYHLYIVFTGIRIILVHQHYFWYYQASVLRRRQTLEPRFLDVVHNLFSLMAVEKSPEACARLATDQ